ncbi:NADH:quinone reductase [Acrasis kona]|uniref:NADH:quinone reductase n=1 Tax=Acrasis kona TaxID=1008807 RepID=A0AAW2YQ50_9EUKA
MTRFGRLFGTIKNSFSSGQGRSLSLGDFAQYVLHKHHVNPRSIRNALIFGLGATAVYLTNNQITAEEDIKAPFSPTIEQKQQDLENRARVNELANPTRPGGKQRLVILGTGWGAMSVVQDLDPNLYEVIVVSPRNYFLFTPMLTATTVGTVEIRSVLEPIRRYLNRKLPEAQYFEAKCSTIDHAKKKITCKWEDISSDYNGAVTNFDISYDYLIVGVGAHVNTFNTPGVLEHCNFLKEVPHARKIRTRMMDILEAAALPGTTEDELRQLLHFVVVGGGPTGVEFSAELRDFLQNEVRRFFPRLMPYISVTMVQSADHLLNTLNKKLSEYAENKFKLDGVNVVTLARVIEVKEKELVIYDKGTKSTRNVPFGMCVWTTGIKQTPLIERLIDSLPKDLQKNSKAVLTDNKLRVRGADGSLFAIGDCSSVYQPKLISKAMDLFQESDLDKDGSLSLFEIQDMFNRKATEYPQLNIYKQKLNDLFRKIDVSGDEMLDVEEFKNLLHEVDKNITSFPQTAQVASKEGAYLSKYLNELAKKKKSIPNFNGQEPTNDFKLMDTYPAFTFENQGVFAYIGANQAVADISGYSTGGFATWFLYRSVYLSKQVSLKNRFALASDWSKSLIFGRDCSRF